MKGPTVTKSMKYNLGKSDNRKATLAKCISWAKALCKTSLYLLLFCLSLTTLLRCFYFGIQCRRFYVFARGDGLFGHWLCNQYAINYWSVRFPRSNHIASMWILYGINLCIEKCHIIVVVVVCRSCGRSRRRKRCRMCRLQWKSTRTS